MDILLIVLTIILIAAALNTVRSKDLVAAVISGSVVSLIASIYFYLLQAPDVALTEAAIGVGLSTIIFIITIRRTGRMEE